MSDLSDSSSSTQDLVGRIRDALTEDLLKPEYREDRPHPMYGHCYVATEALYHLLGADECEWYPVRARDGNDVVHWWLENEEGNRLDVTRDQYDALDVDVPYEEGQRGGFLTTEPSKRTQELLRRIKDA